MQTAAVQLYSSSGTTTPYGRRCPRKAMELTPDGALSNGIRKGVNILRIFLYFHEILWMSPRQLQIVVYNTSYNSSRGSTSQQQHGGIIVSNLASPWIRSEFRRYSYIYMCCCVGWRNVCCIVMESVIKNRPLLSLWSRASSTSTVYTTTVLQF